MKERAKINRKIFSDNSFNKYTFYAICQFRPRSTSVHRRVTANKKIVGAKLTYSAHFFLSLTKRGCKKTKVFLQPLKLS